MVAGSMVAWQTAMVVEDCRAVDGDVGNSVDAGPMNVTRVERHAASNHEGMGTWEHCS